MKKLFTLLGSVLLLSFYSSAQYYYIPNLAPGQNPGNLNSEPEAPAPGGWTTIQAMSASPVWSPVQTIPFTYLFNGSPVTQYKVSTSGVLTFDVATALAAPSYTKAALPDATIPDNSVCIWGLGALGANDNIIVKTFGTAPNRQLWIWFNSYGYGTTASGNYDYTYWSIVLEETSNKIYIVDQRTGGFAAVKQVSAGIQINSSSAYSVAGSPNLVSLAGTIQASTDNAYYEFIAGSMPAIDGGISDVTPVIGSSSSYTLAGAISSITATVTNFGSSPITSLDFKYSDGVNTYTDTKSGLNIPTFGTLAVTHNTTYTTPGTSNYPLTVWIEVTGDANTANDNSNTAIQGVAFFPNHNVVFEEGTGTWCGWCPRGAVYMDSMATMHGSQTVLIAVHNSDPMVVSDYDAGVGTLISGYPSVLVNRNIVADPSNMFQQFSDHINDFGFASLNQFTLYNAATSTFNIAAWGTFAADLTGDYRLAVVITEDDVTGSGATWDQHNYYSYQTNNQPLQGAGHNWQAETDPVLAANMEYDHVARVILGGFNGQAGSLPGTITGGSTQGYNFNWTVPASVDVNKTHINVLLIDAANGVILNGTSGTFTAVDEPEVILGSIVLFPNPARDQATMAFSLKNSQQVMLEVYNNMGQIVYSEDKGMLQSGKHTFQIDTRGYAAGLYSVNVLINGESVSRKLIVE